MSVTLDLFCRVIDNYGDIGVCWRLARQLETEKNISVRLIVDDLVTFKKLEARIDPLLPVQSCGNVRVLLWNDAALDTHYTEAGDVVIEAFACTLPARVVNLMQQKKSVWLDFEYLSAEDWVETCHAIPSPHPATGLLKTLFFPGFTDKTGGLLREKTLIGERSKFQADIAAQNDWRRSIGLPEKSPEQPDASLFCYPAAPADRLEGVRLFVPEGLKPELSGPHVHRFPFLSSADYDRLLWTCDLNFVRGEDSWVRAIWAGKPFIWHIYPQDEDAHLVKLKAFLSRYTRDLPQADAETLADLHAMWNEGGREDKAAPLSGLQFQAFLSRLSDHALRWSDELAKEEDCATRMVRFIGAQLDNQRQTRN